MADSTLYLYTSLTAGSSHLITATSRMETILKANRIPFRAIDCATDEKARQLWGRRSKGKKLPGLVKYGQVVGDLEQVEEWNEFGELVDQIEDVDDLYGDTPMTDTVLPPPVDVNPPSLLRPIVERAPGMPPAVSRTSSDSRHISISEPAEKKEKADTSAKNTKQATPLAVTMAQLGAEAAAKAGLRKTSTPATTTTSLASAKKATVDDTDAESQSTAADVPITKKSDPSETIPTPAQVKASPDAALESTSEEEKQSLTAAKTPAQLASEGVRRTSVDKPSPITSSSIATNDVESISTQPSEGKSTEEQVLDLRRSSSIAKAKSSLAQETSIDDLPDDDNSEGKSPEEKAAAQAVANVKKEEEEEQKQKAKTAALGRDAIPEEAIVSEPASTTVSTDDVSATARPPIRTHRGSSIGEAPEEEIKRIEERNAIKEEEEEDDDDGDDGDDEEDDEGSVVGGTDVKDNKTQNVISATDQEEKKAIKDSDPQDTKAAEPKDAEKSVGD